MDKLLGFSVRRSLGTLEGSIYLGLEGGEAVSKWWYSTVRGPQSGGGVKKEQYDRLVEGSRLIRSGL